LGFTGVHVARSLVFCVVFCGLLFVLLSFLFWPLCCLSFGHCVVCLLIIVLSVFWSLCCLSFGHCVVCLLVIVLSVFWLLCCLSFGHCVVCPFFRFTASYYPFGIFKC
jgi:hypothetical protein